MSKNLHSVQSLMTIPAPSYKHGDLVEWSIDFGEKLYVYCGQIIYRMWCEDDAGVPGHWEYGLESSSVSINGISKTHLTTDTVTESELKPWFRLGIDTETDTETDTGTDTGNEPKRFTNALTSVSI